WLIILGAALVCAYLVIGGKKLGALRVGDLGVGFDEDGKPARTPWYEITSVTVRDRALRLAAKGKSIVVPLDAHPGAAARIAREARSRIPKRVELEEEDVANLGNPSGGEKLEAEPPQVTSAHCRATDEALT